MNGIFYHDLCLPIDVASLIAMPSTRLGYKDLMKVSDYLFRLIGELDESFALQIKVLISEIQSSCNDQGVKSWAIKTLSEHFCQKCSKRCIAKGQFPYNICTKCKQALISTNKCLNCYRKFKNSYYMMPCEHLCKFCGCLWIKKGYEHCPECRFNFLEIREEIKSMTIKCSFCLKEKNVYLNPVLMLSCKHFICAECFMLNKSLKICNLDQKKVRNFLRNTFIDYIEEKCYKCEKSKLRSKMINKTCCNIYQLCLKCVGDSTLCPLCRCEIVLNRFSF